MLKENEENIENSTFNKNNSAKMINNKLLNFEKEINNNIF